MSISPMGAEQFRYQYAFKRGEVLPKPQHAQFKGVSVSQGAEQPDLPTREWPWRGFGFASDLGTLGALMGKPKIGVVGWLIALPYYAYSILSKPKGKARQEEALYQATANGIFPTAALTIGTRTGGALSQLTQKYSLNQSRPIPTNVYKAGMGLLSLAVLTKTLGDPLSQKMLDSFQKQEEMSWG